MIKKYSFFLLISLPLWGQAQVNENSVKFSKTITASELKKHLEILASDEYEGRETAQKGQKMAADYIAKEFAAYGLKAVGGNNTYFQKFQLAEKGLEAVVLKGKNKEGKMTADFFLYGFKEMPSKEIPVIFAGYGIDDEKYSDYKNLDVTGKAVIIFSGEPVDAQGNSVITGSAKLSKWSGRGNDKVKIAKEKGAELVLTIVEENFESIAEQMAHYMEKPRLVFPSKENSSSGITNIFISKSFAASLLDLKISKLDDEKKKISTNPEKYKNKIKSQTITAQIKVKESLVETENVVGLVEGTDKADEIIVISAHYDHIGVDGGEVFNGADDDGSGTVTVIELAQAFAEAKKVGFSPRRSILFVGFTGEEKGLLGSEYYSNNPIFPLNKTVTNLNIDMIGRLDEAHSNNPNYVYLIGTNMLSQELHEISEYTNKTYKNIELDYRFNTLEDPNRFYYRSDHYNFAKHGVPVIFYFNGVHEDYHKVTDTVDKILFDKIENIAQLVFFTAWEIANRENAPKVD